MAKRLDEAVVRHVAHLARLHLSDEELAEFTGQLTDIMGYVEQLNERDTSDVPVTAHAIELSNVFREDIVRSGLSADDALHNAADHQDSFFRVPKVLDQEDA